MRTREIVGLEEEIYCLGHQSVSFIGSSVRKGEGKDKMQEATFSKGWGGSMNYEGNPHAFYNLHTQHFVYVQ